MPTPRGWAVGLTGLVLAAVGITFGATAIQQLGVGLLALPVIAFFLVTRSVVDLDVERVVAPQQAASGQVVTVTLRLTNRSRRRTPLLLIEDELPGRLSGRARFALQAIEAGGTREAVYEVRPPRRGRYDLGPVRIRLVDPFGVARAESRYASTTPLLVHPAAETLALPRDTGEQRSLALSSVKQPTGARGEDFYTLREYVEGDDLRRIHWRSTAKAATFMIRQEETPWHTRATILLDDEAVGYEGVGPASSFERAVEVAASLVDLYHRSRYSLSFTTSSRPGFDGARGSAHYMRCMELLATVTPVVSHDHHQLLVRLAELGSGTTGDGTLIAVVGTISPAAAIALGRCRRRFRQVIVVTLPGHRFGSSPTRARWEGERETHEVARLLVRSGVGVVSLGPGERLAPVWSSLSTGRIRHEEAWNRKPEPV